MKVDSKDLAEVYETEGEKKLKPHLAAVNRPHVMNDTPRTAGLRVPIIELLRAETLVDISKLIH